MKFWWPTLPSHWRKKSKAPLKICFLKLVKSNGSIFIIRTQENILLHKPVILQLLSFGLGFQSWWCWSSRCQPLFLRLKPVTIWRSPKNKNKMQLTLRNLHEEGLATFLTTILFINLFQINRVWYCLSNLDLYTERIEDKNFYKPNCFP